MTDLVCGTDDVISTELQFVSISKKRIDTCMNYTQPRLAILFRYTRWISYIFLL
jgi:hypothetical protein